MTEEETTRQLIHVTARNERAVELLEAAKREFADHAGRCRGMDSLREAIAKFLKPTRPIEPCVDTGHPVDQSCGERCRIYCEHGKRNCDECCFALTDRAQAWRDGIEPMMVIEPEKP